MGYVLTLLSPFYVYWVSSETPPPPLSLSLSLSLGSKTSSKPIHENNVLLYFSVRVDLHACVRMHVCVCVCVACGHVCMVKLCIKLQFCQAQIGQRLLKRKKNWPLSESRRWRMMTHVIFAEVRPTTYGIELEAQQRRTGPAPSHVACIDTGTAPGAAWVCARP